MSIASRIGKAAGAAFRFRDRGGKFPLQVAALPWRRGQDGGVEVLLVTTRGTGQWMVPKGWPMPGKTWPEAAAEEAWEEAGVRGRPGTAELGRFRHNKSGLLTGPMRCTVAVFPLEVKEELERWPERAERVRGWFAIGEARKLVRSAGLAAIIAAAETL
jgi:8-oxo-dGTP pyrophosphatase MutT (NUDIX family)